MAFRLTNDQIQRRANRFARALDDAGVPTRGVVAVCLPNVPEFVQCLRGATWSGRTFTPVNWHLSNDDIGYVIGNSEASALVVHQRFAETVRAFAEKIPANARFVVRESQADAKDVSFYRGFDEIDSYSDADLEKPLAGTLMLYTSGTTGKPKGVKTDTPTDEPPPCMASRMGSAMLTTYLPDDASGVHLIVAPLYHAAPSTYGEGAALLGADVVIMERWDAEEFLRIVERDRVISTFMVPTHFVRLLQLPEHVRAKYDVTSLKLVCHGAAPVSPDVKRRMIDWFGPVLFEFYGGTEGGGVSIDSHAWLAHPGSVGRPRPGLEIHILDEDGEELAVGETGNVYFKNEGNRFEYKDDPEKTEAAYRGDRYTLGDIGHLDSDGYLYLSDRKADTIIKGGVNIYPAQIEATVLEHEGVHDCCVVGLLDDEWGESILAVVEPQDASVQEQEFALSLAEFCKRTLSRQQWPDAFTISKSLPRTETGKLLRRKVRDDYRAQTSENRDG